MSSLESKLFNLFPQTLQGRHDIQDNDTDLNDIKQNNTLKRNTQQNDTHLSGTRYRVLSCWASLMLSSAHKLLVLSVIMLSVIMLNVVAPSFALHRFIF